ncbi:MAG: DUF1571 domain-containing protein [Planctomycetaceae bacterium]|nr:DUF1571 domain-containing protein [Planctomycetaceae bacterium]MCB9950803.1 DUF1571 domain-containing protein [Planctomycetaceae bacterium]
MRYFPSSQLAESSRESILLRAVSTGFPCLMVACCWLMETAAFAQQQQPAEHPLAPAIRMARDSLQRLDAVKDYDATFTKREWVGQQFVAQRMYMKLREQPFSVYLKFGEPNEGREILFVQGKNQNQLLAREASGLASLIGTVSLPMNDPKVTAENRHPISDMGMRRMIELLIEQWERESRYGEIDVKYYPNARIGEMACEAIEATHPVPRKEFPYHVSRVYFEKETRYPIRVENFGFPRRPNEPPPLIEEYTFSNIHVNRGFTEADFDRRNQNYSFGR